ncbi:MAG: D-2-hydroxyacid dehydrogenase [Desulfitobacterium hafniense]|nr:D-2-hydroxyacid dehydrogenase [Desulfitobacterium hafniense]
MKVLSTIQVSSEQLEKFKNLREDLEFVYTKEFSEPDEKVEAILTYGWDVREKTLDLYPNVKWIQGMSAGVDRIPLKVVSERDIILTNVRGAHAIQMAEHVLWSMLHLVRQGQTVARQQQNKVWSVKFRIDELYNKTVCIVGAGRIGETVAERCRAFGMKVLGISKSGTANPAFDKVGSMDNLKEFLQLSDMVVVILPLTPDTKGMFNEEIFSALKKGTYFINVARGPVVDEEALLSALNSGKVAAAALDVFVQEPLPESSPFWEMDNVFITPHIGGRSAFYTDRMYDVFAQNLAAYPDRMKMINIIDLRKGY